MIKHLTPKSKPEVLRAFNEINWRDKLNTEIGIWIGNYFSQLETINNHEELLQFLLNLSIKFPVINSGNIKNRLNYFYKKHIRTFERLGFQYADFDFELIKSTHPLFGKVNTISLNVLGKIERDKLCNHNISDLSVPEIIELLIDTWFFSVYILSLSFLEDEYKKYFAHLFE